MLVLSDPDVDWKQLVLHAVGRKNVHAWMVKHAWFMDETTRGWDGLLPLEGTVKREAEAFLARMEGMEEKMNVPERKILEDAIKRVEN